jgi:hypothetical protein
LREDVLGLFDLLIRDGCRREANPQHDSLVPYILKGVSHDEGLDLEFYKEAIKRFDDDEAIPALFNSAMVAISTKLGTISMEDDYKPYVQVSPRPQSAARNQGNSLLTLTGHADIHSLPSFDHQPS